MIFGVNPGSLASHQKFVDTNAFPFPLLVDADRSVVTAYDALKEDGKSINRTVVAIDKGGKVVFYKRGTPSDESILKAITG